jgi:type II secretory pathway pseudopilin PulG
MRANRRAITLIETMVTMVVLGAAILALAQLVAQISVQRVFAEREALAGGEVANQMERVFALPWEELNERSVTEMQLSAACLQRLPGSELTIAVGTPGGEPVRRKIHVQVTWPDSSGRFRRQASLTAWRYQIGRAEE